MKKELTHDISTSRILNIKELSTTAWLPMLYINFLKYAVKIKFQQNKLNVHTEKNINVDIADQRHSYEILKNKRRAGYIVLNRLNEFLRELNSKTTKRRMIKDQKLLGETKYRKLQKAMITVVVKEHDT